MKVKKISQERGMALGINKYPNFFATGSIRGMKEKYYGKNALLVRCGGYVYNVPWEIYCVAD